MTTTQTNLIMNNVVNNAVQSVCDYFTKWQSGVFCDRKHQPLPFTVYNELMHLHNHTIAVGDAETLRCEMILRKCTELYNAITFNKRNI